MFLPFFIMETSFLLAGKITELTLIVLMGVALVKAGLLKSENSYTLSVIALYLISPSVMIHAFQMDNTPQIIEGLKLSVMLAVFFHVVLIRSEERRVGKEGRCGGGGGA